MEIALLCLPGLDNFVDDLIGALGTRGHAITKVVSRDPFVLQDAISRHEAVWLEWGNELAVTLTRSAVLAGKKVVLRIHSYEVLDALADDIDFEVVDDIVFVAGHVRDIFLARMPDVASKCGIRVIPNGVDLERFQMKERDSGHNLGYLGALNFKKDPMVLMHAFRALHQHDPRFKLHIAGRCDQSRYRIAMGHFLENNGLVEVTKLYGHQEDVVSWLGAIDYVILTSLMEGNPVGVLEAMATGCQPLIYDFPGASALYPDEFIWRNFDELLARVSQPHEPRRYREFVAENHSLESQAIAMGSLFV